MSEKVKAICEYCSKEFSYYRNKLHKPRRFCSRECRFESDPLMYKPTCLNCGILIVGRKRPSELPSRKYCSYNCMNEHRVKYPHIVESARTTSTCQICGKEFWYYNKSSRTGKYCSRKCASIARKGLTKGKDNHNWKGEDRTRACNTLFVMRHLPNICVICGWHEANCDVHHIIPVSKGGKNSLSNCIILCPNHHRLVKKSMSEQFLLDLWQEKYGTLDLPEEC